jgi:hypothetical protein
VAVEWKDELARPQAVVLALERLALDCVVRPVLNPVHEGWRSVERAERDDQSRGDDSGREDVSSSRDQPTEHRCRSQQDHGERGVVERARRRRDDEADRDRHERPARCVREHSGASRAASEERLAGEHGQDQIGGERDRVVRRQEQVRLTAQEVIGKERIERGADQRRSPGDPEVAHDQERRQRREREREEKEGVQDRAGLGGRQPEDLEDQKIQVIAREDRIVVELLPERGAEPLVLEVPTALEDALHGQQVQHGVVPVDERRIEICAPELEHDRPRHARQRHRGEREDELAPAVLTIGHGPAAYCPVRWTVGSLARRFSLS